MLRISLLFLALPVLAQLAKDPYFFQKPYLQLGDRPKLSAGVGATDGLDLMWLGYDSHDRNGPWSVQYKVGRSWHNASVRELRRVDVDGTAPHRVFSAALLKLKPGAPFSYRVMAAGKKVFEADAQARKPANTDSHFVIFGDCAADTAGQRAVAYQVSLQKPDYIFIPGDIVYGKGRVSEYEQKFWPVYNADKADPLTGAPLLRSTLFTGVIGNHDSQPQPDFTAAPDLFGFYRYWSLPLNGPVLAAGGKNTPKFKGEEESQKSFLASATSFPRMANYSFEYGDVHWTVIDSNPYVDFTDAALQDWIRSDIQSSAQAKWHLVAFHHPGFNSSKAHFKEQRARLLSKLFEEAKVDLVISGHVHNYQRTFPMKFEVEPGFVLGKNTEVPGKWTLGSGPTYIITGAGGAGLYNIEQNGDPASFQTFTAKFVSDTHSFTVIDASDKTLKIRQISSVGKELDSFTLSH